MAKIGKSKVSIKRKGGKPNAVLIATFRDPRRLQDPSNKSMGNKVVRRSLKTSDFEEAKKYAKVLNAIIVDKNLWKIPPLETPQLVREIWLGTKADFEVVTAEGKVELPWSENTKYLGMDVPDNFEPFEGKWDPTGESLGIGESTVKNAEAISLAEEHLKLSAELAKVRETNVELNKELQESRTEIKALRFKLGQYNKRAARAAEVGTLGQESKKYLSDYFSRKITRERKGIAKNTIEAFVSAIGENRPTDEISEKEVTRYVQAYKAKDGRAIGEERRKSIRLAICTFLETATEGTFNRKLVSRISSHAVTREKHVPIWLEPEEASRLIEKVKELHGLYWHDFAKIQLHMGWRPSELTLLQKSFVTTNHIELVPIQDSAGVWHAKTGGRSVQIHDGIIAEIERRIKSTESDLLFPFEPKQHPEFRTHKKKPSKTTRKSDAWNLNSLSKRYPTVLREAAKLAGITKNIDSRTLRRSFGSISLRDGLSINEVATVMGSQPKVISKHYARLSADEIDLSSITFSKVRK